MENKKSLLEKLKKKLESKEVDEGLKDSINKKIKDIEDNKDIIK